jgi:hypothetical protein
MLFPPFLTPLFPPTFSTTAPSSLRWLLTQHGSDLGLLTPDSCLDSLLIAFMAGAKKSGAAQCMVQAVLQSSLATMGLGGAQCRAGAILFSGSNEVRRG